MATLIRILRFGAQTLYRVLWLLPVRHKVVFLSRQSDRPSRDFEMLVEELLRRDATLEVVVRCRQLHDSFGARLRYLFTVVGHLYHLATARVCVVDGYMIAVSMFDHRPSLTVIQMWHALGAIKRFGLQSAGKPGGRPAHLARIMRMHRNYDIVLCGGEASVDAFAEAFGVPPERVRCMGLPRVDVLESLAAPGASLPKRAAELVERHPLLAEAGRTRVLYAPTFRRTSSTAFPAVIDAFAGTGCTLIVKPHHLESVSLAGEHVVDATGTEITDLLCLADVVITDYSAVAFEAAVMGRRVYFYVYDIEQYESELGLNFDPRTEAPEVTSADIGTLVADIVAGGYPASAAEAIRRRFVCAPAGGCTAAIADLIQGLVGAD